MTGAVQRRRLLRATGAAAVLGLAGPLRPVRAQGAAAVPAFDPEDLRHARALREAGLADRTAWPFVETLATSFGARPAGSAAETRAAQWAAREFTRLGLSNARAEPVPFRAWQRGPSSVRLVQRGGATAAAGAERFEQPLVALALGNSVAGRGEAEIAWYPDLAALRADTSERAKGRIVFIDQKTERTVDGRGYGAAVGARFSGAVEAGRRGALALAIRSIGTDRQRVAHTGAMGYDIAVPRIPAFAVSIPDAETLARLVARGETPSLAWDIAASTDVPATTHNVIAEIPGGDLAQEIVLIGAHLDSWDVGQGALDDGAGCAIVAAAAATIAAQVRSSGRRPRRTVRVVLFGNEENGFDGARAYGDRHAGVVHQLVGESDFGAGRIWRFAHRVQPAALPLMDAMHAELAPLGIERGGNDGNPGPDAALLMRRHRWPGVALSQDGRAYFDVHHTENDTLERIDPATLPQNVAAWAVTAWLAAQSPLPFGPPVLG